MKYDQVIEILEEIAPTDWLENDNSGIQIHTDKEDIHTVLVCLEMNDDIIEEAKACHADMIITHHPLLFYPISTITAGTPVGRYVIKLIQAGIDVYSSHLSFDSADRGNNMYLADLLGLEYVARPEDWDDEDEDYDDDEDVFEEPDDEIDDAETDDEDAFEDPEDGETDDEEIDEYEYDQDDVGSIGVLPEPMNFREFQAHVESCLDLPPHYVRCVDGGKDQIKKVAFCTGAGGSFLDIAVEQGCDAYITGDLRLHEAQFAKAMGLTVIDAGHYGTEKIFTENMAAQIREIAGDELEVIEAQSNTNPYTL